MTIREIYENVLTELNKVQAPALLLNDFVYIFNKAVQKYFNKKYNQFEMNQQLTDDLRVLTKTKALARVQNPGGDIMGTSHRFQLPDDYVHILNCICEFKDTKARCNQCPTIRQGANKLDTSQWPHVINNYYMRPSVKQPYYYIINIEDPNAVTSNYGQVQQNQKNIGDRYGNFYIPTLEIKCGSNNRYQLVNVYIDYLRAPKYIDLTVKDLDDPNDNTAHLEFPDYVVYEIINEIVTICLENAKDQRIQTFVPLSQSIASAVKQSE